MDSGRASTRRQLGSGPERNSQLVLLDWPGHLMSDPRVAMLNACDSGLVLHRERTDLEVVGRKTVAFGRGDYLPAHAVPTTFHGCLDDDGVSALGLGLVSHEFLPDRREHPLRSASFRSS